MEVGEKAGDESEGTYTERNIPEEEEGEEEENVKGQREEQQVDPCGSSTAPLGLLCREGVFVHAMCKAVSLQFLLQCVHNLP